MNPCIVLHWPRFSAYHTARIQAASERLRSRGIEVIALETAGADNTYLWESRQGSLRFQRITAFPGQTVESLKFPMLWSRLGSELARVRPSAVAVNGYAARDSLAILSWCYLHRCPPILMSESKQDDFERSSLKEAAKRLIISGFASAICGGATHRDYLRSLGMAPERVFTGYDVVDNEFFAREADRVRQGLVEYSHLPGLDSDEPFFLACARFLYRKNLHGLLKAFGLYVAGSEAVGIKPWRLVILGDGEERGRLDAYAREQHLEGVCFAGRQPLENVAIYYGRATAFIHPPLQEQWGLVVNEALAAGLPVIVSTACGCAGELVFPGRNGFLFAPEDSQSLADLMARLGSGELDIAGMGRSARQSMLGRGPEQFAQGIERAFELARKKNGR